MSVLRSIIVFATATYATGTLGSVCELEVRRLVPAFQAFQLVQETTQILRSQLNEQERSALASIQVRMERNPEQEWSARELQILRYFALKTEKLYQKRILGRVILEANYAEEREIQTYAEKSLRELLIATKNLPQPKPRIPLETSVESVKMSEMPVGARRLEGSRRLDPLSASVLSDAFHRTSMALPAPLEITWPHRVWNFLVSIFNGGNLP